MPRPSLFLFAAVFLLAALPTSCHEAGKSGTGDPAPQQSEIRRETCKGPVCVRMVTDKGTLSIAENLNLTIEAEVAKGFEAELPRFGEKLGEFGIKDYREHPPRLLPNGKLLIAKIYILEPFLSGDYTIDPLQVRFRKKPEDTAPEKADAADGRTPDHEITTEAITVRVESLLDKDQKEMALNPIKGPVDLPSEPFSLWTLILGVGAAGLVAGVTFVLIRRHRSGRGPQPLPTLPAHELAFRQLREIMDEGLVERGELKLFFSRISDVLRGYIENRFGIHAPRQTTEEFLSDISREAPFAPEYRTLLVEFLRDCDLVKFAEHGPSQEEITKAIDSCKAFIEANRTGTEGQGETGGKGDGVSERAACHAIRRAR